MGEGLAVYTTWYPGVERFLPEWYRSVAGQSDRGFDLWVGVDGLDGEAVAAGLGQGPAVNLLPQPAGSSPAQVRQRAIGALLDRYERIVFVDSDDVLDASRVREARRALDTLDVSACALRIIDGEGRDLGIVFGASAETEWTGFLPRYNVFGLSNSAYRTSLLRRCLPLSPGSALVDWLLVTRAWALGARLGFDETARMSYRQYGTNIARVVPPFTAAEILAATGHVLEHYRALLDAPDWPLPAGPEGPIREARARVAAFADAMKRSPAALERYTAALNALRPRYVWWWLVAHPDLENVWRN